MTNFFKKNLIIFLEWIDENEVPTFDNFTKETKAKKSKRKKRAQAEAKEAEEHAKDLGLDKSQDSLANLIMQRQQKREAESESFFEHLATKYGKKPSSKKKKGYSYCKRY